MPDARQGPRFFQEHVGLALLLEELQGDLALQAWDPMRA
jgi:hypothetical protein